MTKGGTREKGDVNKIGKQCMDNSAKKTCHNSYESTMRYTPAHRNVIILCYWVVLCWIVLRCMSNILLIMFDRKVGLEYFI